jgi:hypothetical protein
MLISVHLPKTAGTSFGQSLDNHFGKQVLKDYGDWPINTPPVKRNLRALRDCLRNSIRDFGDVKCIHGHFLPLKYRLLDARPDVKFVTWLREPVERIASHYYFWVRTYDPKTSPILQRRLVEENWSLERFCLGPELKNFYGQFLWGFPIRQFDFIGLMEHYDQEFTFFSEKFFGERTRIYRKNANTELKGEKVYITDAGFRREIEAYHAQDVALYRSIAEKSLENRCRAKG